MSKTWTYEYFLYYQYVKNLGASIFMYTIENFTYNDLDAVDKIFCGGGSVMHPTASVVYFVSAVHYDRWALTA